MFGRFAALACASLFILSGCVQADLDSESAKGRKVRAETVVIAEYLASQAVYALETIKPFAVTVTGDVQLKGHVYLPNITDPIPTILEYSPYFNTHDLASNEHTQTIDGRLTMTGRHQHFMDAGFAVALVNIRGTGTSGGCFQWGAELDLKDAFEVVEALAKMQHSDGQVGMIGLSYPGWTQYVALAAAPPSLKAVLPVSGVIDLHSLLTRNGAPLLAGTGVTTLWNTQYSLAEAVYLPIDARGGNGIGHQDCGPRYAEDLAEGILLQTSGDRTPYFQARDLRPKLAESKVPIFFTNGMTQGEGHILQFEGLWDLISHGNKRMLIGQWPHAYPQATPIDFWEMAVAWYDQQLRGGPPLIQMGIVEYEDNEKNWHTTDRWPPASTPATLYLSNGILTDEGSAVAPSTQMFQSVYRDPTIRDCFPIPTQAVYVSPPLASDVLLAGNFQVNLTVTSTATDGNLAAILYATAGNGNCPDPQAQELRRALTDLRHRTPGAMGASFPLNTPTPVDMQGHPFAAPVHAGERLVLVIGGDANELQPDHVKPVLTVTTGATAQGMLTLPVVQGTLQFQ
jgi:uncharacterized protein